MGFERLILVILAAHFGMLDGVLAAQIGGLVGMDELMLDGFGLVGSALAGLRTCIWLWLDRFGTCLASVW